VRLRILVTLLLPLHLRHSWISASLVLIKKSYLFSHRVVIATLQVFSFVIQGKISNMAATTVIQRIAIVLCVDMTTLRIIAVFLGVHMTTWIPAWLAIQMGFILLFQESALDYFIYCMCMAWSEKWMNFHYLNLTNIDLLLQLKLWNL